MTAQYFAMSNESGCCNCYAAAGTSAAHKQILDTVMIAVSIIVVCLINLLVLIV